MRPVVEGSSLHEAGEIAGTTSTDSVKQSAPQRPYATNEMFSYLRVMSLAILGGVLDSETSRRHKLLKEGPGSGTGITQNTLVYLELGSSATAFRRLEFPNGRLLFQALKAIEYF